MKNRQFLHYILALLIAVATGTSFGQSAIELTFTGVNDTSYVRLDSIWVKNISQGVDTTLYYPDTVLSLTFTRIQENPGLSEGFRLMQNYPNPVSDQTTIDLNIPERDKAKITIADASGRQLCASELILETGCHSFLFKPSGKGTFIFSVNWKGSARAIAILSSADNQGNQNSLEYLGSRKFEPALKTVSDVQEFPFSVGDLLMCVGHAGILESGFLDNPEVSKEYRVQFASNIPCVGTPTVEYEGQVYNTVQVFSQCWLKENLNVGMMVPSSQNQLNNGVIEKYCMGDDEKYCGQLGGLYFWSEMMNYTNESGTQGICPQGWHVPGELDWRILEGAVDSAYAIGDPVWAGSDWRGTDAGGNLKQAGTDLWMPPNTGATDKYGFNALPAGYFVGGSFWGPQYKCFFYSSEPVGKYYRNLDWNMAQVKKGNGGTGLAISVRCIKD